jgi:putative ABC transport system ATP-binding protein
VLSNVTLPLKIEGISKKERVERALETLESVGLTDKAKNKATDLSGGEKQRVCIARAMVSQPDILFADEPTGNLDSATGETVENLLFDLNRDWGITLIIVTHDRDLGERCERRVLMRDGLLI